MKTLSGFPYFEVQFTKDGVAHDGAEVTAVQDFLGQKTATDLLLISHGWNNDLNDARDLYARFLASLRAVLDQGVVPGAASRSYAVLAVLWPSIKFADEQLIPSGAAGLGSAVSIAFVQEQLDRLERALQDPDKSAALQRARALIPALPNSPKAQEEFADLVRSALPAGSKETAGDEDASGDFLERSGRDLMDRLSKPIVVPLARSAGGGAASTSAAAGATSVAMTGGAAGITQTFSGVLSGARNLLNYTTYYLMKDRAAAVGRGGVSGLVRQIKALRPDLRVHLIGHSFGARLVTALAEGPAGQPALTFNTLTLLQAAFSHNGFAAKFDGARDGAFRTVLSGHKVTGPIVVTHSRNDRAVGVAYPLASRIAGQDAAGLGDENDKFGGLGRNGAQHTPERVVGTLQPVGSTYTFEPGKIYNLNADAIIADHSDICHNEVAFALLRAVVA